MQYLQEVIASRITEEREALGLTKEGLAERLNVNRNTITSWERQDIKGRYPPLEDLARMCDLFNCELGYLLGEYNCKTRAATDIQAETGLSERAIDRLREEAQKSEIFRGTLSELIESPLFYSLVLGLADYKRYMSFSPEMRADVGSENMSISDLSRMITPAGWAVLSSGDAAEYWLQRAYETFCNMAREIWMKEGDGNNGK
jgi:DNA-binding helix-turn-helix protein